MTYKQAVNWADDIKSYTQARVMPPWKPAEGVPFHNERRLADKDIATVAAWVDGGTPAGDPKDAPPPKTIPIGRQLGTPDVILSPGGEFNLGPDGRDRGGLFLPKGADVVMQVHYHRDGRLEHDRTQVGLYLVKKKVDNPFHGGVVAGLFLAIPPGQERHKIEGNAWAKDDFTLFFVTPHM